MTKLSKRLLSLASFVSKKDNIADIGCDHGLLSIYLLENNLCQNIIASDINANALSQAQKNIKLHNLNLKTYLSDGLKDIPLKGLNTLIISGMGTNTILNILEDGSKLKKISKLIIQSNNDLELLRTSLNNKNYYLQDDICLKDKNKWYITCLFIKSTKKNTIEELKYGYLKNKEYNEYLLKEYKKIYHKIPLTSPKAKIKYLIKIKQLKKATK